MIAMSRRQQFFIRSAFALLRSSQTLRFASVFRSVPTLKCNLGCMALGMLFFATLAAPIQAGQQLTGDEIKQAIVTHRLRVTQVVSPAYTTLTSADEVVASAAPGAKPVAMRPFAIPTK